MKSISATDILQTIGSNLHSIRNARKETLQAAASALGVSHPVISKIENGRYDTLSIPMLVKLCNHYEVTMQQILALDQSQIFQLTQHNSSGSQKLVAQDYSESEGYERCIRILESENSFLRKIVETKTLASKKEGTASAKIKSK